MSEQRRISTPAAPDPAGAYSQAIRVGDFIFTAGQGPLDPSSGEVVGSNIAEQTEAVISNIAAILAAAGAELEDVVKTTVHLADLSDFPDFDATYRRLFSEPLPVRTTVGSRLAGILVEIDAVAWVGA